PPVQKRE
ncbi:putative Bax domain protein, partial [Vibrio parahaemolyticus IDH02640]